MEHLFLRCSFMMNVWSNICSWTDYDVVEEDNILDHFFMTRCFWLGLIGCRWLIIIWLAFCWFIWNRRTGIIFGDVIASVTELIFNIKAFSWFWLSVDFSPNHKCNFYDWYTNLLRCLKILWLYLVLDSNCIWVKVSIVLFYKYIFCLLKKLANTWVLFWYMHNALHHSYKGVFKTYAYKLNGHYINNKIKV